MNQKKLFASWVFILALLLLGVGLYGCGSSSKTEPGPTDGDLDVQDKDSETEAEAEAVVDGDPEPEAEPEPEPEPEPELEPEPEPEPEPELEPEPEPEPDLTDSDTATPEPVDNPGAKGKHAWSAASVQNIPVASDKKIQIDVFVPDGAGPFPVVILCIGFSMQTTLYQSYGEMLASWGYLTVIPDFGGTVLAPVAHTKQAQYLIGLMDWVKDVAQKTDKELKGKADSAHIALAGHSMGGKIALLAASQDARPMAIFTIDPVDSAGGIGSNAADYPSVTPELMPEIKQPVVFMGEVTDKEAAAISLSQPCAPAVDNYEQYYNYAESPALRIDTLGADHADYVDNPSCTTCITCKGGTANPSFVRALTQKYMIAFFNMIVRGQRTAYIDYLTGAKMATDKTNGAVDYAYKNEF